jgi:N-dimethylarginine dimethylaminohydrolase
MVCVLGLERGRSMTVTNAEKAFIAAMQATEREKERTGREQMCVKHGSVYIPMPDTWAVRECLRRVGGREIVYETRASSTNPENHESR